ncbi:hypothetical protein BGX27_003139, partial [Mortierella sp. AM989]
MVRHARKECLDVVEAIESALEANESFTSPSMTITLRFTRKKNDNQISNNEPSDASEALMKHIQLLVIQTDEIRKEQQQRDRRLENFFEKQLEGQQNIVEALHAIVALQKDKE